MKAAVLFYDNQNNTELPQFSRHKYKEKRQEFVQEPELFMQKLGMSGKQLRHRLEPLIVIRLMMH